MHTSPLHHKAIHQKKKINVQWLDRLIFILAIVSPMSVIPQVVVIFQTHNASGVSLHTWLLITAICVPWIAYGVMHKQKPIIINNVLWFIGGTAILLGKFLYS
jgi:uncharacterized protein with PQ loop repeat